MKGLLIDNYDSFTYNLYQMLGELRGGMLDVIRNDAVTIDDLKEMNYDYFVISPGPGHPANSRDFGVCTDVLKSLSRITPTLGICLGHQGIAYHFGASIIYGSPVHGKASVIHHDNKGIFRGLPRSFRAGRYHSLVVDPDTVSPQLEVSAKTDCGVIMGIRHKKFPIIGIQFHPESILTKEGKKMLKNFLSMVEKKKGDIENDKRKHS